MVFTVILNLTLTQAPNSSDHLKQFLLASFLILLRSSPELCKCVQFIYVSAFHRKLALVPSLWLNDSNDTHQNASAGSFLPITYGQWINQWANWSIPFSPKWDVSAGPVYIDWWLTIMCSIQIKSFNGHIIWLAFFNLNSTKPFCHCKSFQFNWKIWSELGM